MRMIKSFLKKGLARFGFEVHRLQTPVSTPFRPGHDAFLDQRALFDGVEPDLVFDIGAHHGQTTKKYRRLFPSTRVLAFEPFPESFEELRTSVAGDSLVSPVNVAISERDGNSVFYSNRADYTNSLLAGDPAGAPWVPSTTTESVNRITVRTFSLDRFCDQHGIRRIPIVKSDVQGAEMRLLRGATGLISTRRVDVFYLEVLFAPLYEEQASFCEVFYFLAGMGYRMIGIYNIYRGNNGFAGWADALFVRDDFPIPACFCEKHGIK